MSCSIAMLHITFFIIPSRVKRLLGGFMRDLKNTRVYDAPEVDLRNTGKILKKLRTINNLTVKDLQEFFGFDYPNAIYDWEKGLKLPCMSNLIALSYLYEVSINDILLKDEQDFLYIFYR